MIPPAPPPDPARAALEQRRADAAEELAAALELLERIHREARELSNAHRRRKRADVAAELEAARSRGTHDAARVVSAPRGNSRRDKGPVARPSRPAPPRGHRTHNGPGADAGLPVMTTSRLAAPPHAVAVTLVNPHADAWAVTYRPPYGHPAAWRNTLRALAARGRTRAYDRGAPRRCTWDSLDGDATL
jgi:hypothetical protein